MLEASERTLTTLNCVQILPAPCELEFLVALEIPIRQDNAAGHVLKALIQALALPCLPLGQHFQLCQRRPELAALGEVFAWLNVRPCVDDLEHDISGITREERAIGLPDRLAAAFHLGRLQRRGPKQREVFDDQPVGRSFHR